MASHPVPVLTSDEACERGEYSDTQEGGTSVVEKTPVVAWADEQDKPEAALAWGVAVPQIHPVATTQMMLEALVASTA